MTVLALLGGDAMFPEGIPFVRPPAPTLERVTEILSESWKRGVLTNGPLVAELERRAAEYLQVPHVIAVSSCTTGLMLALRALEVVGPVVMPSFTFSASAHAVAWNGATPRFAECDPSSFQVSVEDAAPRVRGAAAILATHVFGAPCPAEQLADLARAAGIPLVFDAAHAFGALRNGVPVGGFGDAEVFSLTPTKPLVAGEGGLVATTRDDVAHKVRIGRDYANPGNYDTEFVGLNGRMSEMHAATALASLEGFEANQSRRFDIVAQYTRRLAEIPGVRVQAVDRGDQSTWKDFTIAVDHEQFGIDRDGLRRALLADGVDTRTYFDPPVHRQHAYIDVESDTLSVTDDACSRVLSLPVYPSLEDRVVDGIVDVVARVHEKSDDLVGSI